MTLFHIIHLVFTTGAEGSRQQGNMAEQKGFIYTYIYFYYFLLTFTYPGEINFIMSWQMSLDNIVLMIKCVPKICRSGVFLQVKDPSFSITSLSQIFLEI